MEDSTNTSEIDVEWMRRALELARATAGLASPNPQVGCVVVRGGEVVGAGAHLYDEFDHAEIVALKQAGEKARGATAYVTLEPCSHHGRTGPCADALIAAGVRRVVAATVDPNPQVSGEGIRRLRAAGVEVDVGVMQAEAREVNEAFARFIRTGRPLVTLKAAVSADGMLAPAAAQRKARQIHWITGVEARAEVQRMRHGADAVLTGIGTVLADDPLLTDRSGGARRRKLLRVVLDSRLRVPVESKLVGSASGDVLVVCDHEAEEFSTQRYEAERRAWLFAPRWQTVSDRAPTPPKARPVRFRQGGNASDKATSDRRTSVRASALKVAGVEVVGLEEKSAGRLDLGAVLDLLGQRKILSVMLECGSELNGAFLAAGLVDRVLLFQSEKIMGVGGVRFAAVFELDEVERAMQQVTRTMFGADVRVSGYLRNPWARY